MYFAFDGSCLYVEIKFCYLSASYLPIPVSHINVFIILARFIGRNLKLLWSPKVGLQLVRMCIRWHLQLTFDLL